MLKFYFNPQDGIYIQTHLYVKNSLKNPYGHLNHIDAHTETILRLYSIFK